LAARNFARRNLKDASGTITRGTSRTLPPLQPPRQFFFSQYFTHTMWLNFGGAPFKISLQSKFRPRRNVPWMAPLFPTTQSR
jgi:hypothetical protein